MITLERVKELIVDADHRFIAALEAHLGIHPNRAPAPAAPKAEVAADPDIQRVVNGLETKLASAEAAVVDLQNANKDHIAELDAAETDVANLKAQLDTQAAAYTELDAQTKTLTESLAAAQEQIRTLTAGQSAAKTEGATENGTQEGAKG